jgi:hypothetical protein
LNIQAYSIIESGLAGIFEECPINYRLGVNMQYLDSILVSFFVLVSTQVGAIGGTTVGNGGDLVQCQGGPNEPTFVYKSLDDLLTLQSETDANLVEHKSLENLLFDVQTLIDRNIPELSLSFRDYVGTLWNTDFSESRIWEPAPFGVLSISDEEIGSGHLVPQACRHETPDGSKINLVQAIVRLRERFNPDHPRIVYAYMKDLIESVQAYDTLQISFLLVHEWLWDHSKNIERNRRINRLFHSKSFYELSPTDARSLLLNLGFLLPTEESQWFDGSFCQATSGSISNLLSLPNRSTLGQYAVKRRIRYCDIEAGCGVYHAIESDLPGGRGVFNGAVRLNTQSSKVLLTGSQFLRPSSECNFDDHGKVVCGGFYGSEGFYTFNGQQLKFSGNISSECLHLKNRVHNPQSATSWTETEFATLTMFAH